MRVYVAVATGAVIGATARWAVGEWSASAWAPAWASGRFPWATLLVNLVGCALVGRSAARWRPGSIRWSFGVTGVLGGLTTTSAFAVETRGLLAGGDVVVAAIYVAVSVGGGAAALLVARRSAGRAARSGGAVGVAS